jgi:dTDP-4-amino-4,6-dideoxygalactose transaminase
MTGLAVLGDERAFPTPVPFVRVPTPPLERVVERLRPSYDRGILTNGPLVAELESAAAARLAVRDAVAVASCTAGLMLALRALAIDGPVLLPGFTFSATAHAVAWNGLRPVFADCDPATFQLDCVDAAQRVDSVGAVMATHVFGAPCDVDAVEALARRAGVPAIFDAAHAFGARRGEKPVGASGAAEVFSLSPTKPVVAGEGGIVATGDPDLAAALRIGRDYGNPGDYDTRFVGLNARMSELHAAMALESLVELDEHLAIRRRLAERYARGLEAVPGIATQRVPPEDASTWKDFTVSVDASAYGVDRDALVIALRAEGVDTRCYFDPPVHRQQAYAALDPGALPVTEQVATSVVSLPLYRDLEPETIDRIVEIVERVHRHSREVSLATA